jgi:hypothetical protein
MSRAFITSFHNYSASLGTDYYKIFYDYFVYRFPEWCDLVDAVYILDTNWNFKNEDIKRLTSLHPNVLFYKTPHEGHHNKQYQDFLPQIKEDEMLFMDNDVFIFKRSGISDWFYTLKHHDAIITFAPWKSYPPGDLRIPIWNKYPNIKDRGVYMDSCHFLITRKLLNKIDEVDFMNYQPYPVGTYIPELDYSTKEGDWCEFFAPLWFNILMQNNWDELPPCDGMKHVRGCSYAYLLLSYKELGLPQYAECLKQKPMFKNRLKWFMKIDIQHKYTRKVLKILNDKL